MVNTESPSRTGRWTQSRQHIDDGVSACNCTLIWAGGYVVGQVSAKVFFKKVRGSKHFLRKPPAIAFDIQSLEDAKDAGASTVRVLDEESGMTYQASIETIFTRGFPFDRGHGKQIGLAFRYWQQGDDPLANQLQLWV
jgi:hypothetical protein